MGEGGHGAGEVERIHRKRRRRRLEVALEDPRQGAGLLFLQGVVPFREGWAPASLELELGHEQRAIPPDRG